jgi:hypothetical protein
MRSDAAAAAEPNACCLQVGLHDAAAAGAAGGCTPESGPCGGLAIAVGGSSPAPASGESASPADAAAGLVEGGELRDAANDGDLAAVEARPPASLARPRSEPHRLQRLLAEPAGRAAVNAGDDDGYAPVFLCPVLGSNITQSQARPVPMPAQVARARE